MPLTFPQSGGARTVPAQHGVRTLTIDTVTTRFVYHQQAVLGRLSSYWPNGRKHMDTLQLGR